MNECTKSKRFWGAVELMAIQGMGIDIGCGPDPVTPTARRFDKEDGDANRASEFINELYDFVYSSHCLEHMFDPKLTILDWWKLVKPGGYLFVIVPDEDLYEQGVFPSRFNDDHKATFTICKAKSWSPTSVNVLDLARLLPNGELINIELQDRNYDRTLLSFGENKKTLLVRCLAKTYRILNSFLSEKHLSLLRRALAPYFPIDQTANDFSQAQIQLIVKKVK